MRRRLTVGLGALIVSMIVGCGGLFQPDIHEGGGAWRRGDGSVYRAAEPVPVLHSEALTYSRRPGSGHEELMLTVALHLANGEMLILDLAGSGTSGGTTFLVGERAASSGANYAVTVGLSIGGYRDEDRARISVVAGSLLHYESELAL